MKALRHIPNAISLMRIFLVAPFIFFLLTAHYKTAFFLFLVAGVSDGFDGFLARKFNWTSYFGAFVDPLADKILMISSFFVLAYLGELPILLVFVVIMRDFIIMLGVSAYYYFINDVSFEPTAWSKLNTALQIAFIVLVLFELAYKALPDSVLVSLQWMVLLLSIITLLHYLYLGITNAVAAKLRGEVKHADKI